MDDIFLYDSLFVSKSQLGFLERQTMLGDVRLIFGFIIFELHIYHYIDNYIEKQGFFEKIGKV
jgi:hypothetical protein